MSASPKNYLTMLDAVNSLRERGYTYDYDYENACLYCKLISEKFKAIYAADPADPSLYPRGKVDMMHLVQANENISDHEIVESFKHLNSTSY